MISFDEALARVLSALTPTEPETTPFASAGGRVLAAPLIAQRTQPPVPTSAMDGFAVKAASLAERASRLRIMGEAAAGHPLTTPVGLGQAAHISTGAAIPPGADQVVVREESAVTGEIVTINVKPAPGAHIRPAGIDFSLGDTLIPAGRRLGPAGCALAASAGARELSTHRRPRVAFLSTGDELVEPGEPVGDHQIVNSNAIAIAGLIEEAGGEPLYLGIARDDPEAVRALYARARGADLLVTIGGASVGQHDHVRAVFTAEGGELLFEKIDIKPGKPTWLGRLGALPIVGLPGNPVSALVVARLLFVPAVRRLAGETNAGRISWRQARLAGELPPTGPRETFLRAVLAAAPSPRPQITGESWVSTLPNQDSAALSALVGADALVRRRAGAPAAKAGDVVEILPLRGA
jgi:molybdopterin molybdotransferase